MILKEYPWDIIVYLLYSAPLKGIKVYKQLLFVGGT